MGTDDLGRDLLAGVVHGARTSLIVAGAVTVLALLLGVSVGAIAGWRGGLVDDALMRLTEFVQIVPRFFWRWSPSRCSAPGSTGSSCCWG